MRPCRLSLNWKPSVGCFFLALPSASSASPSRRSSLETSGHLDELMASVMSSFSASLFFSRKLVTL